MLQRLQFAERQKATRQLKKLRRRLLEAKSEEDVTTVKAKMHVAEVDLNYTQYYPLLQSYVSLYPQKDIGRSETGNQDEHIDDMTKKPPMWAEVEKRMVDGTLNQLRNGSGATVISHGKSRNSKPTAPMKPKAGSTQAMINGTSTKPPQGLTKPNKESAKHPVSQPSNRSERRAAMKATEASAEDEENDEGFFEE